MKRLIIGVTGFAGSGKSSVAQYLESKGFDYYSVRKYITAELDNRKIGLSRENMTSVANEMRKLHGASYFMDLIAADIGESKNNIVFESVRNIGEVDYIRQLGGVLLATEADIASRYRRICCRGSETDDVSFDDFKQQEHREMSSKGSSKQNMKKVIEMADVYIENNADQEILFRKVDQIISTLRKK